MTSTERKIFEIISTEKKVSIFEIAKKNGISTDYANLICQGLKRNGYIDILGNYCTICKPAISKEEKGRSRKISKKRRKQEISFLSNLKTLNKETAKILRKTGYKTVEEIASTPFSIFVQTTGISLSQAAKIFNEARKKIGII